MNVLDLFSGIGGFSLGLERAGMRTVAFCEIDPYARAVLAERWPDVPCHGDITARDFRAGEADIICGGFPCQDISLAGSGAGLAGERSGLWRELLRALRLVRPRYAIVENVAALLSRGMGTVLGDMAEIGYDAEWHCIPAAAVGAPHRRDRVWIIANPGGEQHESCRPPISGEIAAQLSGAVADADQQRTQISQTGQFPAVEIAGCLSGDGALADAISVDGGPGRQRRSASSGQGQSEPIGSFQDVDDAMRRRHFTSEEQVPARRDSTFNPGWWATEPGVGRVADGVPARVDRLKALGNAVVPQIPEIIGRAILASERC